MTRVLFRIPIYSGPTLAIRKTFRHRVLHASGLIVLVRRTVIYFAGGKKLRIDARPRVYTYAYMLYIYIFVGESTVWFFEKQQKAGRFVLIKNIKNRRVHYYTIVARKTIILAITRSTCIELVRFKKKKIVRKRLTCVRIYVYIKI